MIGRDSFSPSLRDINKEVLYFGGSKGLAVHKGLEYRDAEEESTSRIDEKNELHRCMCGMQRLVWAIAQSSAEHAQLISLLPEDMPPADSYSWPSV